MESSDIQPGTRVSETKRDGHAHIPQLLKDSSLKAAGWSYLLGDAALMASGIMSGRTKEAIGGGIWGAGGLACAVYGNPGHEMQAKMVTRRLSDFFRQQGVTIPPEVATNGFGGHRGVISHAQDFVYAHPSETLNLVYALGGVQMARSGIQHKAHWDTASGALVTSGALAGLLIPEQGSAREHHRRGLGRAVDWLEDKPLRLSSLLYGANNVTMLISAAKEMKGAPAQKSYLFKFLTAASYLFANGMLALSSKEGNGSHGVGTDELAAITALSAHVLAAQPAPLREVLVAQTSHFLSHQPEVTKTAEQIAALLNGELARLGASTGRHADRLVAEQPPTPGRG